MEQEIWKSIKGYEEYYQISNLGRVKALEKKCWNGKVWYIRKEQILKPVAGQGYDNVVLKRFEKRNPYRIHSLIATYFIPNPENKPFVNHINHIRNDNRLENLEWITQRENCSHAKLRSGNKTGFPNVKLHSNKKAFSFCVRINKKRHYKGYYKTPQLAHIAYLQFLKDNNITNKYATAI